jgi:hypothetical protein
LGKTRLPVKSIRRRLRTAASSSRNAVNFSSAPATKHFPLSRCASAIQIRPLKSIAETQPQLQPALGIVDHLRGRLTHLKLCAHFLDLLLQLSNGSLHFLSLMRDSCLEIFALLRDACSQVVSASASTVGAGP